jgi:hypothetical protein
MKRMMEMNFGFYGPDRQLLCVVVGQSLATMTGTHLCWGFAAHSGATSKALIE